MKLILVYRNAIRLDKPSLSEFEKTQLFMEPFYKEFLMYENDYYYLFPSYFLPIIKDEETKIIYNKRAHTPFINPKIFVTPRDWQKAALSIIKSKNYRKGLIKMPVGSGKTIFSLLMIAQAINKKSIIVVDKDVLKQQWLASCEKVFGTQLRIKDLSREDFDKNLEGIDIGVVNVQLLLSLFKDFDKYEYIIRNSGFDCVIYDEAHTTTAAKAFMRSLSLFRDFRFLFGLTATPKDYINRYVIGEVIIDAEKVGYYNKYKENLKIDFIKTNYDLSVRKWAGIEAQAFLANYYTSVERNKHFINNLYSIVNDLLYKNRNILLVVNRLSTIPELKNLFPNAKILTSKQKDTISSSDNLVIATYNIASKGLDIEHLDTIVSLSIIRGNISTVQLIGRILRNNGTKKNDPLVIFVYDTCLLKHEDFKSIESDILSKKI